MIRLVSAFRFLVQENIWIAVIAASYFVAGFLTVFKWSTTLWWDIQMVFCSTWLIYTGSSRSWINKLLRKRPILNHSLHIFGLVICMIGLILWTIQASLVARIYLIHLGIVSILYFFPVHHQKGIRWIPYVKVLVIAYVWAQLYAVFPPIILGHKMELNYWYSPVFISSFLFIVAITLPFDLRDYIVDKKANLMTLPGYFGPTITKFTSVVLLVLSYIINWNQYSFDPILSGIYSVFLLLIIMARTNTPKLYFTGLMDGAIGLFLVWVLLK